MALSIMTYSIRTLSIIIFGKMTLSVMPLSIKTISIISLRITTNSMAHIIMTLTVRPHTIMALCKMTLSIRDTHHYEKWHLVVSIITYSIKTLIIAIITLVVYAECNVP